MTELRLREFHGFEAAGRRFVYLVPSAAVFALDDTCDTWIERRLWGFGSKTLADLLSHRLDISLGIRLAFQPRFRSQISSLRPASLFEKEFVYHPRVPVQWSPRFHGVHAGR